MTLRPAAAAAVVVLGLAFSPLMAAVPAAAQTSPGLPTEVALVVPLTVPASTSGFISRELLADYTAQSGHLTRSLDQLADRPVTIAIDPMIIASIRVLGTDAPESAVQWLDRLARVTNETFALSWADSSLSLGPEAGSPTVLSPESLEFAIDPARFGAAVVKPTAEPTSTPTPDSDNTSPPPLPSSQDLLAWNYTLPSVAWPASDTVTAVSLSVISASYDVTLLSSTNLAGPASPSSTATVGGASVLVSDAELSSLFSSTVSAFSGTDWEAAVASLGVSMTTSANQPGASSAIVTLDRSVRTTDIDLGPTIDAINDLPAVALVGLSDVAANPGAAASLTDKPLDPATVAAVAGLLRVEALDATFAQIAADPSLVTSERRLELLAALSNSWSADADGWQAAVESYITASTDLRHSVSIVKSSSITLWADRGSLPVIVNNSLDQPVTVYITVRPLTPLIRVEDSFFEFVVEPNSEGKAPIPVQSISNGVVALEISLHARDGTVIGNTTYVKTTVQAGWETPFTIGAAIVVILIFAAGVIRTILRRRRARAERITIA